MFVGWCWLHSGKADCVAYDMCCTSAGTADNLTVIGEPMSGPWSHIPVEGYMVLQVIASNRVVVRVKGSS